MNQSFDLIALQRHNLLYRFIWHKRIETFQPFSLCRFINFVPYISLIILVLMQRERSEGRTNKNQSTSFDV